MPLALCPVQLGVTLVPTLVRGVNIDNICEIVRFAVGQSPWVRGIHFQPVSYFGRMPQLPTNSERFTLDELVYEIDRQTHGSVSANSLLPSCCDHPLCGFHGDFVVDYQGGLYPLSKREHASACCCDPAAAEKNREFVARRWLRHDQTTNAAGEQEGNLQDMEHFLNRVKSHGFTITSMAFQDAGNIDLLAYGSAVSMCTTGVNWYILRTLTLRSVIFVDYTCVSD